jgi:hypothetical protein
MDTRVKSHAEQYGETPRVIPTRLRREIAANAQGTKGEIIGEFFQICRLTFANESCWNDSGGRWCAARPCNRHALVNLGQIEDQALSGQARLRAFLKALKYNRRPDLPQRIDILLAEAPVLEEADLVQIIEYLEDGPVGVSDTLLREALQGLVPEQTERIMGKWTQSYFDQGKAEGLTQGWAKGRTEGGAKVLVRLIERRFGVISPQLRQRIFSADVATLEAWVERVSDASDLQSVFDSN